MSYPVVQAPPEEPSWLSRNWLGVAMLLITTITQVSNAGSWSASRTIAEKDLVEATAQLRDELRRDEATYVRQDVFNSVMQRIDERLRTIADAQAGRH